MNPIFSILMWDVSLKGNDACNFASNAYSDIVSDVFLQNLNKLQLKVDNCVKIVY
ncbi:hypothetical protein J32TS6_22010 [Virgibacillus pantothenticus]|nr:hypothetical protein J32TS6_22010 [Virgibacillus pantothenticus]